MGVYKRGRIQWIAYAGPNGETIRESTKQTDPRVAERIYRQRKREVLAGTWTPQQDSASVTLAEYAERWFVRRRDAGVDTAHDEEKRLRTYVLPKLGAKALQDIRRRDVVELVAFVRTVISEATGEKLAPRSVHHVYGALRSLYADALADETVIATPCTLRVAKGELPKKRDADPTWRASAIYTRDELETIISAPPELVPNDRRVLYSIELLAGLRFGEAAGRRWRDYDARAQPLGSLLCATQYEDEELKTENPRTIPVHPVLAAILAEWKMHGFPELFGRPPRSEDWIVPSREWRCRTVRHGHRKMQQDLVRLGLRERRQHDTRRTFISLCRADGAPDAVLKSITHGPPGEIIDDYTTWPWPTLCAAVSCLRVSRRMGEVVPLTSQSASHSADGKEKPAGLQRVSQRGGRDSKQRRKAGEP